MQHSAITFTRLLVLLTALTAALALSAVSLRPVSGQSAAGIALTKVVNWNGVTPYAVSFQICITSDTYHDCENVQHGQTALFSNIPPGMYTVTEPGTGPLWSTQISQNPIEVTEESAVVNATVTNTHVAGGSLVVSKQVNWNFATPDPTKVFNICISGAHFSGCQNVTNGNSVIWTNLPPGNYTVSETNPGAGWGQYTVSPSSVVAVQSGGVHTRTVTNTRVGGGRLDVAKVVDWAGQTPIPGVTFQVCISSSIYAECKAISPGTTISFGAIPPGLYTVTEVNPGAGWATPTVNPSAVWVYDGQISTSVITNTRGGSGRLEVQKLVRWNGVTPVADSFEICIHGATLSDCKTIVGAGVLQWNNLPAGPYSVTETNPGPLWSTPVISQSPVQVVNGQTANVTVLNDRIPVTVTPTATSTPPSTPTAFPTATPTATVAPPTATPTATMAAPGPPSTGSGTQAGNPLGLAIILAATLLSAAVALGTMGRWRVER